MRSSLTSEKHQANTTVTSDEVTELPWLVPVAGVEITGFAVEGRFVPPTLEVGRVIQGLAKSAVRGLSRGQGCGNTSVEGKQE